MRRLLLLCALVCLGLTACMSGGPVRRINPPGASVQRMVLEDSGALTFELRVQNFSTVPMRFVSIDTRVEIGGTAVGRLTIRPGIEIPGQAADVVSAALLPEAAARDTVRARLSRQEPVAYHLEGRIVTEEPDEDFPFTHDSVLNPVPGKPNEFR